MMILYTYILRLMPKQSKARKNFTMYNQTLYEVEKVMKTKWIKNKQHYYIKWKNYSDDYNSWEPSDHVTYCLTELEAEHDEDSDYREAPVRSHHSSNAANHTYKTRTNIRRKNRFRVQDSEKEDHTYGGDVSTELRGKQQRSTEEFFGRKKVQNSLRGQLSLRYGGNNHEKQVADDASWIDCKMLKENLIGRIIQLNNEGSKAIVELSDKKIAYLDQQQLKKHYPDKVIEYYQKHIRNLESRST